MKLLLSRVDSGEFCTAAAVSMAAEHNTQDEVLVQPVLNGTLLRREKRRGSAPSRAAGTDKQAQGCAGEGLTRVRARVLAVTREMSHFASTI
jgi:hypothetical protein